MTRPEWDVKRENPCWNKETTEEDVVIDSEIDETPPVLSSNTKESKNTVTATPASR